MPESIAKNTYRQFLVTLESDGQVVTTYGTANGDTCSAVVWAGSDRAAVATPTTTWKTDGSDGQILVAFAAADTATVDPGRYRFRVVVNVSDGRTIVAAEDFLDVLTSPGSATAPTSYVTYSDLLHYYDGLADLQSERDQEGLANHSGKARKWYEGCLQRHYRQYTVVDPAFQQAALGWGWFPGYNKWLQDQLDADLLMVLEPVIEINAKRALGTFLSSKIGPNDKDSVYQRMGRQFLIQADNLFCSHMAFLDLNGDGYPDISIDCSKMSMRSR